MAQYIFNDENKSIYIPSNLSLIATMNSSDQNVFTLDTAFKRRWNTKYINNEFNIDNEYEIKLANTNILDTNVTWSKFISVFNKKINNYLNISSEDKRIGKHFVKQIDIELDKTNNDENKDKIDNFANKVLNYLYEDAFKLSQDEIFNSEKIKSFDDIIEIFVKNIDENNDKNKRFEIFKEEIFKELTNKNE